MKIEINKIYNMNCLEGMKYIEDKSIDMILCDLPYGTTACKWDVIIPFEPLWEQYERIIKDNGAIVLTATQPFTTKLITSNLDLFKYCWVWEKDRSKATNFTHAKNSPLKVHEDICVFSKGLIAHKNNPKRMTYNPQGLIPYGKIVKGNNKGGSNNEHKMDRPSHKSQYIREFTNYPVSIIKFNTDFTQIHPTQKPVALFEYLINTYTYEQNTILDNCMGSGTTAIACINTNRNYIGFEWCPDEPHDKYFILANKRIEEHKQNININK
jgi:site-specific DNA-methyltransferase (adenine-specific)